MKVKLYEQRWLHKVNGSDFHRAIEEANIEEVKANAIALLEKCKEFFDPEEQDYVISEIEDLIESFTDVMEDEEEVDFLLDELYDFCDGYNIFIQWDEPKEKEEPIAEPEELPAVEVEVEPETVEEK